MSTTTTQPAHTPSQRHLDDASARELEHEIQRTRCEMDQTIDKLGERLDPRNLIDGVLDIFRGNGGALSTEKLTETMKSAGKTTAEMIRRHPLPALLCGAGAVWWIAESSMEDEHGAPIRRRQRVISGTPAYPVQTWRQEVPAWHEHYDWSRHSDADETTWKSRVDQFLAEMKSSDADTSTSHSERMRRAASKLVGLSGHKRAEIHARWANLREHSGSFVDARTGEPYDSSYGKEWRHLASADAVAGDYEGTEDASISEKAAHQWESIKKTLNDTQSSSQERLRRIAETVSEYASQTGKSAQSWGASAASAASHMAGGIRDSASAAGHYTGAAASAAGHYTSAAAHQVAAGAGVAQEQLAHGAVVAKRNIEEAVREYPLAVGAACFGLGLLAGLVVPHSRYEDEWIGETSDEFKREAKRTGAEALESGKRVAAATAAAAMDEAERQGLGPEHLAESAREAATAIKEKASEAAHQVQAGSADIKQGAAQVVERAAETAKHEASQEAKQFKPK